jgi:hypothetical protein
LRQSTGHWFYSAMQRAAPHFSSVLVRIQAGQKMANIVWEFYYSGDAFGFERGFADLLFVAQNNAESRLRTGIHPHDIPLAAKRRDIGAALRVASGSRSLGSNPRGGAGALTGDSGSIRLPRDRQSLGNPASRFLNFRCAFRRSPAFHRQPRPLRLHRAL